MNARRIHENINGHAGDKTQYQQEPTWGLKRKGYNKQNIQKRIEVTAELQIV
jgi:hypothetical protein